MCYEYDTIEYFSSEMQKVINIWGGDLKVTCVSFRPEKIFSTPFIVSGEVLIGSKYIFILMQLKLSLRITWENNIRFNNLTQALEVKPWEWLSRQMEITVIISLLFKYIYIILGFKIWT